MDTLAGAATGLAEWAVEQWPNVYPNLIASGICTAVVWLKLHLANKRLHERLDALHHHLTHTPAAEQRAKEQP